MTTSAYITTITNWASINPVTILSVEDILDLPSVNTNDLVDPAAQFKVKAIDNIDLLNEVETITGQQECAYQIFYPLMNNVLIKSNWGENRDHCFCYVLQTGGSPLTISFYDEPAGWDPEIRVVIPEQQSQFTLLSTVEIEVNKWYNIKETKWWKFDGLTAPFVSIYFTNQLMNSNY